MPMTMLIITLITYGRPGSDEDCNGDHRIIRPLIVMIMVVAVVIKIMKMAIQLAVVTTLFPLTLGHFATTTFWWW